jgi:hypothetical protein
VVEVGAVRAWVVKVLAWPATRDAKASEGVTPTSIRNGAKSIPREAKTRDEALKEAGRALGADEVERPRIALAWKPGRARGTGSRPRRSCDSAGQGEPRRSGAQGTRRSA